MRVVTTRDGRPHPVGKGLTSPTLSGKSNTPFPSLPLRQTSRTTVAVFLQYMLRESRCYFFCHTPKKWGVRIPRLSPVNYAYAQSSLQLHMGHLNYEYVTFHVIRWFCVIGGCYRHLPSVSVILRHTASKTTQYDALFEPDSISAFCTRVDAR